MLGFNGGRIGVANTTSITSASGMWSSLEVVKAVRVFEFPNYIRSASGGDNVYDISVSGINYRVHEFTTVGVSTFTITEGYGEVEYLIIGGGGGGSISNYATGGGAGGSGGYRCSVPGELSGGGSSAESPLILSVDVYTVIVGDGGSNRSKGQDSVFATITSIGGGHGGGYQQGGATTGGSGGGGAYNADVAGASGTANQGFAGGYATIGGGGGGGGAGSIGSNSSADNRGGNGGNGITSEITGVPIVRGGGGGGGTTNVYIPGAIAGTGGTGGGGNGSATGNGSDGTANTGGGGGGPIGNSSSIGGKGGSGIVIIRYKI
jgi:hypothetical protein